MYLPPTKLRFVMFCRLCRLGLIGVGFTGKSMTEVPAAQRRGQKLPKLMRFLVGTASYHNSSRGPWSHDVPMCCLGQGIFIVIDTLHANWWVSKGRPSRLSCFSKDIPISLRVIPSLHRRRSKTFSKNMTSTTTASSNMMWLGNICQKFTIGIVSKPIWW